MYPVPIPKLIPTHNEGKERKKENGRNWKCEPSGLTKCLDHFELSLVGKIKI